MVELASVDGPLAMQDILRSARKLFARHGYPGTTTRAIAQDAQVDPALIYHYYGSKERLFAAAIDGGLDRSAILAQATDPRQGTPGERLIRAFLRVWDDPSAREPMLAMVRSALAYDDAVALISDPQVISHIVRARTTSQHELRTALIGSVVIGVLVMRYVFRIEPFASLPPDAVATILGPVVDRCLAEDLPLTL
jgi:AcrR family transcriptional regulator